MSRVSGRAAVVSLAAVLLLSQGGPELGRAPTFDLARAAHAREALAGLPQAVDSFRAGRYAAAAGAFETMLARLPETASEASAAALLQLEGPDGYRALRAGLHGNLGVCRLRQRRFAEAARALEEAARLHPRSHRHALNLGVVLARLHRYGEAQRWLEQGIALGGGDAKAYADLARARLETGDLARARRAATRSLAAASRQRDVQAWGTALEVEETLAEADLAEGRAAAAEARLRSVLARAPGQVSARYRLVQILERAGRRAEAAAEHTRFEQDSALAGSIQAALAGGADGEKGLRWAALSYQRLGLLHLAEVHYVQLLARDPADAGSRRALWEIRARARQGG